MGSGCSHRDRSILIERERAQVQALDKIKLILFTVGFTSAEYVKLSMKTKIFFPFSKIP